MAPSTRSTEVSPTTPSRQRKTERERANALRDAVDAANDRSERTKRGCWTCRIRRKKCDEEHVDDQCATCRRLQLDCLGWGVKRPDWMKDKKAVDNKRAEIKLQLQSQNMIRGQAKHVSNLQHRPTAAQSTGDHSRTPSSYLVVPDPRPRPRTSNSSPSILKRPSAPVLPSSSSSGSRFSARPQRAAKLQANRNLDLYTQHEDAPSPAASSATSDISHPTSPTPDIVDDDIDASGEDDYSTSPFLSHDDDSDMSPLAPEEGLPTLGQRHLESMRDSRSAEVSLADLLLPSGLGAYPEDINHTFGLSDDLSGNLSMEATLSEGGVLRSELPFDSLSAGFGDPFENLGLSIHGAGSNSMGGEDSFDAYNFNSTTLGGMLGSPAGKDGPGLSFASGLPFSNNTGFIVKQQQSRVPRLDTDMDMSTSDVSSAGPVTSPLTSAVGGRTVGVTVTSPTGITSPVDEMRFGSKAQNQSSTATSYLAGSSSQQGSGNGSGSGHHGGAGASTFTVSPPVPVNSSDATHQQPLLQGGAAASIPQHSRGFFPQPAQPMASSIPSETATGYVQQQSQQHAIVSYAPRIRSPLADPTRSLTTFQETLIFYYFNRGVRRMQYLLADDSTTGVTDVMYDLVIRDPLGPVTNAICSLASLHDTRLRIAHGLIHPDDPTAHDNAQKLYSDTVMQLAKKAGVFTDVEAIASLHLLSFWLFCGGGGDWGSALGLAGDWLARTELVRDEARDPMDVLADWKPAMRFAAQTTLWFDILAGCSLKQAPRFLRLYRRLKKANAAARESSQLSTPQALFGGSVNSIYNKSGKPQRKPGAPASLMDPVMGCDDEIMFALGEISALAEWKEKQLLRRRLSIVELVERGQAIAQELTATKVAVLPGVSTSTNRRSGSPASPNGVVPLSPLAAFGAAVTPSAWDSFNASNAMLSATAQAQDPTNATWGSASHQNLASLTSPTIQRASSSRGSSPAHAPATTSQTDIAASQAITLGQLCSNVFREAAFLYLSSVVSGCEPAVREISDGITNLINAICAIPSTDLDRSLAFPITLGGCLTDRPEQREFFAERLAAQGSAVGNGSQAKLLMETVWRRRDMGEKGVCWRETMKDLGFDLYYTTTTPLAPSSQSQSQIYDLPSGSTSQPLASIRLA